VPSRQEQVLDAAIAVLGRQGVRHLTHRAVDAAASVPAGSTSNYFRTRDALLEAVVERFADCERQAWEEIAAAAPTTAAPMTAAQFAAALAAFARHATSVGRVRTLARYSLFVEAALRPNLQRRLAATSADISAWGTHWLRMIGSTDPERDCRIVLNQLDGLMLHELAFSDPDFDPLPELIALIQALVSSLPEQGRPRMGGTGGS
jgi:DNA-binding transcriptional regulator YbjK